MPFYLVVISRSLSFFISSFGQRNIIEIDNENVPFPLTLMKYAIAFSAIAVGLKKGSALEMFDARVNKSNIEEIIRRNKWNIVQIMLYLAT